MQQPNKAGQPSDIPGSIFGLIFLICGLLVLGLWSPAQAAHETENRDLAAGQLLYQQNCGSCHGVDLQGQPNWQTPGADGILPAPPHDQTGHTWHHANGLLFDYTKLGGQVALAQRGVSDFNSGMPAFGDSLSDDQIWDILAFIKSTWPPRIQKTHELRNPPHQ